MMNVKTCNLQGVTDTLFREFMSQPGERQWCSELLLSIIRGECVETKGLLKVPLDPSSSIKGSPRGSPLNSPRNQANLSPLLLPPSPRFSSSPNLNNLTPSPTARSPHANLVNTHARFDPNESHPCTPTNATGKKFNFRRRENASISPPSPPILPAVSKPSVDKLQELKNQAVKTKEILSSPNCSPSYLNSPKEDLQNEVLIKQKSETISPSIRSPILKPQIPSKKISPLHSPPVKHPKIVHKNVLIPKFYFPNGRPQSKKTQESIISQIDQVFLEHGGQITLENMEPLTRACQVPVYWKCPLFLAAGGENEGCLNHQQFTSYWIILTTRFYDEASQFFSMLSGGQRNYLLPEDFFSFVQDVVDTHPGLSFLREAQEFHSRYVHTVIARIFYNVNRSWSGKISLPELRRSNLLQIILSLEEEDDVNQITEYFSYEHFYVIYCKFWELDTDHDLFIDKNDLAKHNERALSMRMIERIFSGAVTRGRLQRQDRMGYQEFVWFLLSEEDKKHPAAIEYWFRCMDIDGDGIISMYELEYFYEEQLQRMEALGIETLPFIDCLCQVLDMVQPEDKNKISLRDLKSCKMTTMVFDILFNLEKYLDHEQRDPFSSQRMEDGEPVLSDWDRYAAEEYEFLVAEEGGGEQPDDVMYGEEEEEEVEMDDIIDGTNNDMPAEVNGFNMNKLSSTMPSTVTSLTHDSMDNDQHNNDIDESDDFY